MSFLLPPIRSHTHTNIINFVCVACVISLNLQSDRYDLPHRALFLDLSYVTTQAYISVFMAHHIVHVCTLKLRSY
jgi:hypothetical protein